MNARTLLQLSALALVVTGCHKGSEGGSGATSLAGAPPAAASSGQATGAAAADDFQLPAAGSPGFAYFSTYVGVYGMDTEGKISLVKGLPKSSAKPLTLAADGAVYALMDSGGYSSLDVYRLEGGTGKKLGSVPYTTCQEIEAKDGKLLAKCNEKLFEGDGKKWTEGKALGILTSSYVFDRDGKLWCLDSGQLYRREGADWKVLSPPFKSDSLSAKRAFAAVPQGLFLLTNQGVYKADGDNMVLLGEELKPSGYSRRPASSRNGVFAIPEDEEVVLMLPSGSRRTLKGRLETPVVDTGGRIWSLEQGRVEVIEPDGKTTEYPMGSIPELLQASAGTDDAGIAVAGAGPKLPPVGLVHKSKSVKGKIVKAGSPVAGAELELCPDPELIGSSPCSANKLVLKATTGAEGQFDFKDVPLGRYRIAFNTGDKWGVDYSSIDNLKENADNDLGTLKYDR